MGLIVDLKCKDCQYWNSFLIGSGGFLYDVPVPHKVLYSCPKCDNLCVQFIAEDSLKPNNTIAPADEKEYRCQKCDSMMVPVKDYKKLACPNCHGSNIILYPAGHWD